jgi:hypothetical protein
VGLGRGAGAFAVAGALAVAACSAARPTSGPGRARQAPAPAGAAGLSAAPLPTTTTTVVPTTAATTTTTAPALAVAPPAPLSAGKWTPIGLVVRGVPALTAMLLSTGPGGPTVGVVRIDRSVTRPVLYAGTAEPGGTWPDQGAVPAAARPGLVAAFNAGFHTWASGGGWFAGSRAAVALRAGAASLVIRADGSATVGLWGRDASLTPDVVAVRQNLGLLVDGGANLAASGYWGATLGGVRYTWRSGLGVDASGNLLYCGGPGLDGSSLAQVLIQAGAVRAMELDINPQWVSFSYYGGPGPGADLLPGMVYGPSHWLTGSARDFVAVVAR